MCLKLHQLKIVAHEKWYYGTCTPQPLLCRSTYLTSLLQNPAACLRAGYHRYQTEELLCWDTPPPEAQPLTKHNTAGFFLKWQSQQFSRCSLSHIDVQPWEKAKWQGIPACASWCLLSDSDGWAGDKGQAVVPFRGTWHGVCTQIYNSCGGCSSWCGIQDWGWVQAHAPVTSPVFPCSSHVKEGTQEGSRS